MALSQGERGGATLDRKVTVYGTGRGLGKAPASMHRPLDRICSLEGRGFRGFQGRGRRRSHR